MSPERLLTKQISDEEKKDIISAIFARIYKKTMFGAALVAIIIACTVSIVTAVEINKSIISSNQDTTIALVQRNCDQIKKTRNILQAVITTAYKDSKRESKTQAAIVTLLDGISC